MVSNFVVVTCSTTSLPCESFIGQSVIFQCTPDGSGDTVQWELNETEISNGTRYSINAAGTLTINEVRSTDGGSYTSTCADSGSILLTVKSK